jgi:tRNA uridine 5-carbamoylmethylation protein Kti12
MDQEAFFKITNYEAVLRDGLIFSRFKPDLVILDEAQRIKNFTTKTATAVKQVRRNHALVLTGTPLGKQVGGCLLNRPVPGPVPAVTALAICSRPPYAQSPIQR